MSDQNFVLVEGRLTRDVELKYTTAGTSLANLSVATNYGFKKGDEWENRVSYIDVTAWGKLGEKVAQLKKGAPVIVIGRMEQQRWQDQSGGSRSRVIIVAETITEIVAIKREGNEP